MLLSSPIAEIGAHIQIKQDIYSTIQSAIEMGMYSFQFFMGSPKSFTRKQITDNDIRTITTTYFKISMNIFSHAPYLFNLAGSKDCLAWNGDQTQDSKTMNVIKNVEYELSVISNFNNKYNGVIVHPGNNVDREKGLLAIAKSINKINFTENSHLLLENTAGQGTSLCTTFLEIKTIIDNIDPDKLKYIGVCVDTAHIFGFGEYDISKLSEMIRLFDEFEKVIGIDYLKLIHLNDSAAKLKTRKDRHQLIGDGYIWSENKDSLEYLLNFCKKHDIPIVLETEPHDVYKF